MQLCLVSEKYEIIQRKWEYRKDVILSMSCLSKYKKTVIVKLSEIRNYNITDKV